VIIRFPGKPRRRPPPDFDPIGDVLAILGPGRHLGSEIAAEVAAYCAIFGKPVPHSREIGKRLSALGAKVARDRVYDVPEVAVVKPSLTSQVSEVKTKNKVARPKVNPRKFRKFRRIA